MDIGYSEVRQKDDSWVPYAYEINHGSRFGFPSKSPWCDVLPVLKAADRVGWFREIVRDLEHGHVEVAGIGPSLMLSGYSYLGLNRREDIRDEVVAALDRFGTGSAGSRWLAGHTSLHRQQEELLAEVTGTADAVTFASGYVTNATVIPALVGRHDEVFGDRLNHASLVDGCRWSGAKFTRFPHNDLEKLESQLRKSTARRRLVVVDGVTSMAGTVIRADELKDLCERYEALLMVDECHSHFVLGPNGRGVADYFGMPAGSFDLEMGTMGKALHAAGGYVAGSRDLCNFLRRAGRGFIYSRSVSPIEVAAGIAALDVFKKEGVKLNERLRDNRKVFVDALREAGMPEVEHGPAPIVPIPVGPAVAAIDAAVTCQRAGVFIHPVTPPVVPQRQSILRASIMASHRPEELRAAAKTIVGKVRESQANITDEDASIL